MLKSYVVCYSGGIASALVAIETVRKYGKESVILLNHDISPKVEHEDVKRFKNEVSEYLGVPITYANMENWESKTPLDICVDIKAFKVGNGTALCTNRLKTAPFEKWLKDNYPSEPFNPREDLTILYGFDNKEKHRIQRRIGVLLSLGYKSDYPLAFWDKTIESTEEIGIKSPSTYGMFKHANCIGCLKAGMQHWYCVYCLRPDIWEQGKKAEQAIGYSIIKNTYLEELEPKFYDMKNIKRICPTEKIHPATFWAKVRKELPEEIVLPCECTI